MQSFVSAGALDFIICMESFNWANLKTQNLELSGVSFKYGCNFESSPTWKQLYPIFNIHFVEPACKVCEFLI